MSDLRQAAQQALEALEERYVGALRDRAIEALEAALAEPEQKMTKHKPVAWTDERGFIAYQADSFPRGTTVSPLYAHPPTPRKPLSLDEIQHCADEAGLTVSKRLRCFARAIERAHGIGEQHE